jgi:hypothetical protein
MPLDELPLSAQVAMYNNCAVAVPHEILSTWVGDAARMEARIAELERERCEHCGATLNVSGCQRCGAPVCCPQCCQIQSLTERVAELEREQDEALKLIAKLKSDVHIATSKLAGMTQRAHQAESADTLVKLEAERDSAFTEMSSANCACMKLGEEITKLVFDLRKAERERDDARAVSESLAAERCITMERAIKAERERDDALQMRGGRPYRCPDCNGQSMRPSNGVAMWCTLCGGTGAVSFDPSLDK